MKPFLRVILGVLVSLALVLGAYLWVNGMMDSVFGYRSPLKDSPPAPGQPLGKPMTRRVVFVLIDALRYDTSMNKDVMPVLNRLRMQGAAARMHSQTPSYSQPGYTTLLTGGWPDINDGPPINLDYAVIPTFTQDDIFSAAQRAGLSTAISGYNWFEKLVPQAAVQGRFYTAGEDRAADLDVVGAALPWLRNGGYQLVLIHIDQVDYAGHHEGGPRDARWNEAAQRADALLGEVVATLDLSQDTLLVASDHGQIDAGGHGGQDPVVLIEPFVLAGRGVKPGGYGEVNMVDVAPTLAVLLGTNLPATSEGQPLVEMLALDAGQLATIRTAWNAQQALLISTYEKAIGTTPNPAAVDSPGAAAINLARDARLARERLPRGILAGLLLLVPLGFILARRSRDTGWLLAGALVFVGLFNLRYAILDGRTYSLSSLTGVNDLILYVAVTAFAAFLLAALLVIWRLRLFSRPPVETFLGVVNLSLLSVYLLSFPVMVSFVLNGWKVTWTLPGFLSEFLALLASILILMTAASGLLVGLAAWLARKARREVKVVNG